MKRLARVLSALAVTAAVGLVATGCAEGELTIGDSAQVDILSAGEDYPFEVTVLSLDAAPADVQAAFKGDDTIYFAEVQMRYTGRTKDSAGFPHHVYGGVLAKLADGTLLDTTFPGFDACPGEPADPVQARTALEQGEDVRFCAPLSSDGGNDVVGVYVGNQNIGDGGKIWMR